VAEGRSALICFALPMDTHFQHYGWLVSPYSAKTRSYLRFKQIPFQDQVPTARQLGTTIRRAVGKPVMPTLLRPDGVWMQDSSEIIDHLEKEFPEPALTPRGPAQRLVSLLIELHADEWLPIVALHYRWNLEENSLFARNEFARFGFPWLPRFVGRPLAEPMARKMSSYLPLVGVSEETIPGIGSFTAGLIEGLDEHFARHSYLLGGRPCLGDFALLGPLWAHLYRDPGSRCLFDEAPEVTEWMRRMLNPTDEWGGFLLHDEVPTTLDPLLKTLFDEQFSFLKDLIDAIDTYCDQHPNASRVPRSLGDHPFVIGGQKGTRKLITFTQWMAQRPLSLYQGLSDDEREKVDRLLIRTDGLEAMQLRVRNPFERRNFKMALKHSP